MTLRQRRWRQLLRSQIATPQQRALHFRRRRRQTRAAQQPLALRAACDPRGAQRATPPPCAEAT
eukprot:15481986-Alexandrium_andersonii.AAC.1